MTIALRMDVTEFGRLYLPIQQRKLIHPYSDQADCATTLEIISLEEALADKLKCLLQWHMSNDPARRPRSGSYSTRSRGKLNHTTVQGRVRAGRPLIGAATPSTVGSQRRNAPVSVPCRAGCAGSRG
jgi:hypothetical protein